MTRRGTMIGFVALMLAGCDAPSVRSNTPDDVASIERGRSAAIRLGCGACHAMPGTRWPRGAVGPALDGLATRALIAGRLPNRPAVLRDFVRNAPALVPGTAMPAIAMTDSEAGDIAAWLHSLDGE